MVFRIFFSALVSIITTIAFVFTILHQFFPSHLIQCVHFFASLISPYIQITFDEFSSDRLKKSDAYTTILIYLSRKTSQNAKKLKAEVSKGSQTPLVLSMDDNEVIIDEFQGAKLWWNSRYSIIHSPSYSIYPAPNEKRSLTLTFHKHYRDLITGPYIKHILKEGKAIKVGNRQLMLYTNNPSSGWQGYKGGKWSHIVFEHPATFETMAMDQKKKEEIRNDLNKFKAGKEYYAKIGKAWKRGYLLYGPPGTGKSTMIAAITNFMNYDVYDLELAAVKDNTELKRLLIEISSKSIIVIEDIDCSLDLTGQRNKKKKEKDQEDKQRDPIQKAIEEENKNSKVTLSGLLNFIDGIWSSCGGERIIIFTTNHVDKLDPALIRRGRMDKHIELSYCGYEGFKVLAKNYLDIESDTLFPVVKKLLRETNMTPADVAENLMPKSNDEDPESCLQSLIKSLEEAKKKAEEETMKTAEEEEMQLKAEKMANL